MKRIGAAIWWVHTHPHLSRMITETVTMVRRNAPLALSIAFPLFGNFLPSRIVRNREKYMDKWRAKADSMFDAYIRYRIIGDPDWWIGASSKVPPQLVDHRASR